MKAPGKLKAMNWKVWAMLIMAVVIVVLLFFPKSCGVQELKNKIERVEDDIRQKEKQAAKWQAEAIRLRKEKRADSLKSIETENKYVAKITILEKRAVEKRRIAQPIIESNDTIKQLVQAMDSVHAAQKARISELKDENRIQALVCRDLTGVQLKELTIVKSIDTDKDVIIKSLEKANLKLTLGRTVRNIVIPVVAVGAFVLGVIAGD